MKTTLTIIFIAIIIFLVYSFIFFQGKIPMEQDEQETEETEQTENEENEIIDQDLDQEIIGLANPASVYCLDQQGKLETINFDQGEDSVCLFDDQSFCWQWDFFNEKCQKTQLKKEIIEQGQGRIAGQGDNVTVHYVGRLIDGTKFDSSRDIDRPFNFNLGTGQVIAGWDQGILGTRQGDKIKLTISPELAYGDQVVGGVIPANSTLIFEVEILEVK
jgi:peptidylprolyl isomerase